MANKSNNPSPQSRSSSGKPRRRLDVWNKIAVVILTLFLVGCVSVFFVLVNVINDPDGMRFSRDGLSTITNSRVFDDQGEMVYEFGYELREDVTYEQLPQSVIDAFLSIEDSRFFEHNGFDLPRFMAAAITNLRSGSFAQGGSTLTMQMIDNAFTKNQEQKLAKEKGSLSKLDQIKLKIQEIYLALVSEQTLSKDDIMEYYVNRIWFGSGGNTRGIQKAAKYYFNKSVEDLNLGEAAFLAGSINAPYINNPLNNLTDSDIDHLAAATERRNTTLQLMLDHGYITEEEYNLAKNTDLAFQLDYHETISENPYESYISQAIQEVIDLTGQDPAIIPMDIYTAMNSSAQAELDKIMNGQIIEFPNYAFDVGTAIVRNNSGEIVAVGPGRSYHSDAADAKQDNSINLRQPGSLMKPLLGYSSAFDILGWSTVHIVEDKADDYWNAGFDLANSDGVYDGKISLEYALGVSKNTPAAATMVELVKTTGTDYWIDFMEKLGYDQDVCDKFSPQYVIGGADMFASPVQMASAYSMLANGGTRINAHRIRRIIRRSDNEEIKGDDTSYEIVSEQAAWLMSQILRKVVTGGYYNFNNYLDNPNYVVYGKSGTSDWSTDGLQWGIPQGNYKDNWSCGYTSEYTIVTWSGYPTKYAQQGWYMTQSVLYQATPFHLNRYMLDFLAPDGNYHALEEPGGISPYKNGYIKTEFLSRGDESSGSVEPDNDVDDTTPSEMEAEEKACVESGGSFDNGACSCPDGYYLNGSACEAIQTTPIVPEQPEHPEQPIEPEQPDNPGGDGGEGGDEGGEDYTGFILPDWFVEKRVLL